MSATLIDMYGMGGFLANYNYYYYYYLLTYNYDKILKPIASQIHNHAVGILQWNGKNICECVFTVKKTPAYIN